MHRTETVKNSPLRADARCIKKFSACHAAASLANIELIVIRLLHTCCVMANRAGEMSYSPTKNIRNLSIMDMQLCLYLLPLMYVLLSYNTPN